MSSKLPKLKKRRIKSTRSISILHGFDFGRFLIAFGTIIVLSLLLSVHLIPDRIDLRIGDRLTSDIRAARTVKYVDTTATNRTREEEANSIPVSYEPDPGALGNSLTVVMDVFDTVRRVRNSNDIQPSKKEEALTKELGSFLKKEDIHFLVEEKQAVLDRMQSLAKMLVQKVMARQIRPDTLDLESAKAEFKDRATGAVTARTEMQVLYSIGVRAIGVNYRINRAQTAALRDRAARRIPAIIGEIRAGDIVARQGEAFSQLHLDICRALGLITPRLDIVTLLSVVGLSIVAVTLIGIYLKIFLQPVYYNHNLLLLLATTVCFSVLGLRLFGQTLGIPLSFTQVAYFGLMMIVSATMVIAVLIDAQLAIIVAAILSALSGLVLNRELRFTLMTLVSCLCGIYCVSNFKARGHLLRASIIIGIANVTLVWIIGGLSGDGLQELASGSMWAIISSAFAICIFWFAVTFLERPFGILTNAWLLELSQSDHPLLRELCLSAPGTYAHSIMVGNLAETGAEAIGANSLFCRVASYYHDVGKMRRPHCFIENQHGDNIHTRLNPSLSALIIASHVKDGMDLAAEHKLPHQIAAIIQEHHGTSLIRYFYNQALATYGEDRHDPVLEQHYRYEGPKPQTRESGIIMMADTVEAAIRTLDKPTPARIQSRVETLIQEIMSDGQLEECDLTFKDIKKIGDAFSRLLSAMHHSRVDYPEIASNNLSIEAELLKSSYLHGSNYPELPKSQN